MNRNIDFLLSGGITGASTSYAVGNVGIVGGFGGISLGFVGVTTVGTIVGSAVYGAIRGVENQDTTTFTTFGLGTLCGIGTSVTMGGIGVSFGGSVLGLGMGSMATMGGILGLGIYGLARMFSYSTCSEPVSSVFDRMEEKIAYEEAYYQAMIDLSPTLAELSLRQKFTELEFEEELAELKKQIKIGYKYVSQRSLEKTFAKLEIEEELAKLREQINNRDRT